MAINTAYTQTGNTFANDARQFNVGNITYPATTIVATDHTLQNCGFTPRYIVWVNRTSRIRIEWYEGMAAETCMKIAANGTGTIETTNKGITICNSDGTASTTGRYFKVSQNATLAAILASEVVSWVAFG